MLIWYEWWITSRVPINFREVEKSCDNPMLPSNSIATVLITSSLWRKWCFHHVWNRFSLESRSFFVCHAHPCFSLPLSLPTNSCHSHLLLGSGLHTTNFNGHNSVGTSNELPGCSVYTGKYLSFLPFEDRFLMVSIPCSTNPPNKNKVTLG